MTPAQRGMWFAESLAHGYSVNIAHYLDFTHEVGGFDLDLFVECCEDVGKEVESPYVRLTEVDGVPMQYVDVDFDQHVDVLDFRGEDDPQATALAWMQADYRRPVDLLTDQFIVMALIQISDTETFWYSRCHHIIIDGYAALAMMRRVVGVYNARRQGRELVVKPAASMAEIIAYEDAYQTSSRRETDRKHWLSRVQDLPEGVTLSHASGAAPSVLDNIVVSERLDPALEQRLEEVARDCNSSMAVLLTSAFGAFLARMTGTDDVVLSLPVTGRSTAVIKRSAGMVSNILPIRLQHVLGGSVRDLVAATQLELTGALRYQRYRSDDIKRDAGLDGSSMGFGPRINMVFFDEAIELDGATVEYRILTSGVLEDLLVNLYQASPGAPMVVDLHGNPHLYSQGEVETHHRRFLHFVADFIERLDSRVADVDLLLPGEAEGIEAIESGPTMPAPTEGRLVDLFAEQAATHPDRIAVSDDTRDWTYREFDTLRCRLAAALHDDGVRADDRVAVRLDRGVEQVVAIYAVLTLGAAYVPVDPNAPVVRTAAVLETARPSLVIDDDYLDAIAFTTAPGTAMEPAELPDSVGHSAYVIFTSGSTGVPKGVDVPVAAVANRLAWMQLHHPIGASDAVLYKTPFTFDVSAWELLWPLQVGSRMVIAKAGGHRDPDYLRTLITDHEITVVHFVPSMLDVFVDAGAPGHPVMPASVRRVFTSGEGLPAHLAQRVVNDSDAQMHNLYGPTEAGIEVTEYRVRGTDEVIPIGRPVPNTSTYVLDARLRRVPVGVAGELYLAGRQLADGYLDQEGLTAERFVADPFVDGERMYRTGDLVQRNADGDIEYLGRTDFQVKIRGQRIELGEIEATLLSEGSVEAVTVIVRTDAGSPAIVGYVRSSATGADATALTDRLLRWCRRHLPRYMIPSALVLLDAFPVNASGKLDRAALPAPVYDTAAEIEYVEPATDTEKQLISVLSDLIDAPKIGMRDNMFALGADSLTAARLASRLRNECGVDLGLADVFESEDLAELAARMDDSPEVVGRLALAPMVRPTPLPVAYAQTRLWFINRLDPAAATYNMPGAVRLGADVDLEALRAAALDVLERHESLRTRFPAIDGEPSQEILAVGDLAEQFSLPVIDVAADDLAPTVVAETRRGFDLIAQTPFRATLLRADDEYYLVLVLHHIAGDGASLRPLISDLLTAYGARHSGAAPAWPPLPVQYADYALWQRAMLGEADDPESRLRTETAFWEHELAGMPEILELPADRTRPRTPSGRGAYVDTELPAATVERVRELAATLGVTTFTVLHSALAVVLGRLADQDDVAIGTAVAGRDEPATADLIGMFVNTVVLRTPLKPSDSTSDVIVAAHRARTRALAHSQVPFEQVVDAVAPNRSRTHSPLFQVTFTLNHDAEAESAVESVGGGLIDARPGVAKVDLEVAVTERFGVADEPMSLEFCYATDLFDRDRIELLANQFASVVTAMIERPDAPIGRIDLLSEREIAALSEPLEQVSRPDTLRALIAAGAAQAAPLGAAIVGNGTLTHRLLASRTNQLAREMIARGIGAEDVVAVSIPRSGNSVVAQVAVAKTGAAFLMIDPRHPVERRTELVVESGAVLGLTSTAAPDPIPGIDWITIDSEADELQLAGHSGRPIDDDELVRPVGPDNAAYILFTSGSTGKPKGAVVSNRAITNVAANSVELFDMGPQSCMLHVGAPSFDGAAGELATAWLAGARIAVADFDTFAGLDLENFIARHGATHAMMTPAAVSTLDPVNVPTFVSIACGGEALPPEMVHRWAALGDRRMMNIYGPTEAAVWVTCDGPYGVHDEVTIGPLGTGVGAVVLDSGLRPVPDGVMGEMYVFGDQVGRGYLGRSDLTATRFVANPFTPGAVMYRTGDRVTRRTDGRFLYHGRQDFQLKIRGQRIEPGELDAELLNHPDVTNAVSLGVPGPAGDTVLVSYVTLVPGSTLTEEDLSEHIAQRLPVFLVPRALTIVDEFEWTPIGKIDRRKLPPVDFSSSAAFEAPRTQMESVVADIFGQLLGLDRVSANDDFFDLGGNSLSATKVAARLGAVIDSQVPVAVLFEAPTVSALAVRAAELMGGRPSVPLGPRPRAEVVPVSGVQRGMWLLNRADPASPAYNIALALQLEGDLDVDALRTAVEDLIGRHESLRTSYPMINGEPSQLIGPVDAVMNRLDLAPVDVTGSVEDAIRAVTGVGFDVTQAPPVRLALLRLGPTDHVVVLVIHHISADGASMAPMARDLMSAYAARVAGAVPAWSPLRVQYADFALWQQEQLAETDAEGKTRKEQQLDYWKKRLAGAPEILALPTDRPRPPVPSFQGAVLPFEIPADLVAELEALAQANNSTLFMLTQAAYAILLTRLSGSTDVVVGSPYVGRSDAALDDVIGMFVNTLALRTVVDPSVAFTQLLARVRADSLTDLANADVAFDEVTSALGISRTAAVNPVFQAMFWFQNLEFPSVTLGDLAISAVSEELAAAKVDFQLTLFPQDPADLSGAGGRSAPMRAELMYAVDLFDQATIEKHAQRYLQILTQIAADPDVIVGDISISTSADLAVSSDTSAATVPLPDLVADAGRVAPEAVALTHGGASVDFATLATTTAAMAAVLPDADSALVTALMSLVPPLATDGPAALGSALEAVREAADAVMNINSTN
ncbi:amino acid adenylation domain-containing protein [Gordonia phthalatica]|uniref:amino acid adenylation domain-containing protein n=1 Tax=Gordonia phthalatica TaxID=1136941 RepID=UPI002FF448D7